MALPYVKYEKNIIDEGLETGMKNLTQERIDKALAKVLDGETGAKLKAYVDTCVHCGLCSDACHMYLSTKRDPKLTPAGKVKRSISILVNNRGKITPEIIKKVSIVAAKAPSARRMPPKTRPSHCDSRGRATWRREARL